jgi:hypothetical protein
LEPCERALSVRICSRGASVEAANEPAIGSLIFRPALRAFLQVKRDDSVLDEVPCRCNLLGPVRELNPAASTDLSVDIELRARLARADADVAGLADELRVLHVLTIDNRNARQHAKHGDRGDEPVDRTWPRQPAGLPAGGACGRDRLETIQPPPERGDFRQQLRNVEVVAMAFACVLMILLLSAFARRRSGIVTSSVFTVLYLPPR